MKPDYVALVSASGVKCSDGRTILNEAFKSEDGKEVPIYFNHDVHPDSLMGKAKLRHDDKGLWADFFVDGKIKDKIKSLFTMTSRPTASIFATDVIEDDEGVVSQCNVREVSFVSAGANPGAYIYAGDNETTTITVEFLESEKKEMTDKEKSVPDSPPIIHGTPEKNDMRSLFNSAGIATLTHSQARAELQSRLNCLTPTGTLRHALQTGDLTTLLPEFSTDVYESFEVYDYPRQGGLDDFLDACTISKMSRIVIALDDITNTHAQKHTKGTLKVDQPINIKKRVVYPEVVYKRRTIDRKDVIDLNNIDVLEYTRKELRMKQRQYISRQIMFGGMDSGTADSFIIPIAKDSDFASQIQCAFTTAAEITASVNMMLNMSYRMGSARKYMYLACDACASLLTAETSTGDYKFDNLQQFAMKIGVEKVIPVPWLFYMAAGSGDPIGIMVDPADYVVCIPPRSVGLFADFDIDYNTYKVLYETNVCGSLKGPGLAVTIQKI